MKKNFVKKTLASTLALAMVATATPAAFNTASAAAAPKLNKSAKTLYINENEIGSSFDFNISNKVAKSTYKWTTSNKAVATVKSNGLVTAATKTGKATITCKITLPTKKTKTLKATVTVKENATKVECTNVPTDNTIGMAGYDFNSKMTSASGAKATDYRVWEVSEEGNTAKATIDAKSGVVTVANAGEFKVRVVAYQNKAKLAANDTVVSDWMTIKVVPALQTVAQNSVTKLTATFDDNMKDKVKAADFAIKNKATNVVSAVKGVSFSDDGKVVTVETFAQFADNATYVVTYGGKDFEVATTVGEVATVEITTATVVENKEKAIEYVLKNANGIDITAAKSSTVTIEATENNNGWLNDGKLTIFEKGKTAKIKVTYHTYKYAANGTEEGAVSAEAVITAVEESAATVGNYKNYVIADKAPNWNKVSDNKNVICINEDNMQVFLKALDSDNKDVTGLKFSSGNEDLLLVSDTGALVAVKEGSTVIVVKNEKDTVLWTLPVVIKAERKDTTVSLSTSTVTVVNNGIKTATTEFKVADQYGDSRKAETKIGTITPINGAPVSLVNVDDPTSKVININADKVAKGSYQYKVFLKDSDTKFTVLTVVVKEASSTNITSYKLSLSDTAVDTVVDADTELKDKAVTGKVIGMASGVDMEVSKVYVEVSNPDGKVIETSEDGTFSVNYITASGSELVKAAKGSYKVTAYADKSKAKVIALTGFAINDTQVLPTITINDTSYKYNGVNNAGNILAILQNNCKVVSSLGAELKAANNNGGIVDCETSSVVGNQVNVKTITVKEILNSTTGTYVLHKVNVNKTFTIQ